MGFSQQGKQVVLGLHREALVLALGNTCLIHDLVEFSDKSPQMRILGLCTVYRIAQSPDLVWR